MAEETDPPEEADLESMFEGWFQERMKKEQAAKERTKQPKDFGEFLDKVADAVWERGEQRAAARRKEAEDADQPPERGEREQSGFANWWTGGKEKAS